MSSALSIENVKMTGAKSSATGAKTRKSRPEALAQQYRAIRKLVAKADRQDVRIRYQIAVRCLEIRQGEGKDKTYGANAAQKLAKRLGWSKTDVYDYAAVAEAWPDKVGFDELAAKTDKFTKPLTWTHFRIIARTKDAAKRDKLIQDCLASGWSVRELKRQMDGTAVPNGTLDAVSPESNPLVAEIHSYASRVAAFKQRTDKFRERLAANIGAADPRQFSEAARSQLWAARNDLGELIKQLDEIMAQYEPRQEPVPTVPVGKAPAVQSHFDEPTRGMTLVNPATKLSFPNLVGAFT